MSFLTEGERADVATFRQIQFDDRHKDTFGNKVFRRIPFDYVEYEGDTGVVISGWEPVDSSPVNQLASSGGLPGENSSKHATSIAFQDEDSMFSRVGVGGQVGWPRG